MKCALKPKASHERRRRRRKAVGDIANKLCSGDRPWRKRGNSCCRTGEETSTQRFFLVFVRQRCKAKDWGAPEPRRRSFGKATSDTRSAHSSLTRSRQSKARSRPKAVLGERCASMWHAMRHAKSKVRGGQLTEGRSLFQPLRQRRARGSLWRAWGLAKMMPNNVFALC